MKPKNNKLYIPADCIARHEDFDAWYPDGTQALHFRSEWKSERDKVKIDSWLGGEIARINPDAQTVKMRINMGRWEYALEPYWLFEQYHVDGLCWDIFGSMSELPVEFTFDYNGKKDAVIRECTFSNKGKCWEITCKEPEKLRLVALVAVAIAIKEEYKGLSQGVNDPTAGAIKRVMRFIDNKGIPYDKLCEMRENGEIEALRERIKKHDEMLEAKEAAKKEKRKF